VDARVLTLKSEQKKVTANMMTLNFENFPKMTVQDGLVPVPKGRLEIINPMAETLKSKGLIPMTIGSGEIMWLHSDIVQDEQWETSKPKLKDKSSNTVFLITDDNSVTVTSLNDSEEEKLALTTQLTTSLPVGTRSSKQYLQQYDQTPEGAPQPMTSGTTAPTQATVPNDKEKQKVIRFDESLKKNPSRGLNTPFRFDILTQFANISARITLHKLLRLSKKRERHLGTRLLIQNPF